MKSSAKSYVVNRRGEHVPVLFDMITERNEELKSDKYGASLESIDSPIITAEVVKRFRNGMTTRELDAETAAICTDHGTYHSDYECLAARIYISDLHKRTPDSLHKMVLELIAANDNIRMSDELIQIVARASAAVDIDHMRDYKLRFFGFQTLARSYLLRGGQRIEESSLLSDQLMERPQHLYMRVALGIFVCQPDGDGHTADDDVFRERLADAKKYYDALSLQLVSNATPTMLNAGTSTSQLSSCFQIATGDDLSTLFDTVKSAALISKWSGGVSLWLHNVRAEGSIINGTLGTCSGIKRYIKILNEVQLYVDQGGNRPGAFAAYLSVDHLDVFTFLAMARLRGEEALKSMSAPDIKYALWVPDLFMEALEAQLKDESAGDWYLFSPDTAPGLHLVYGDEYRTLYNKYVAEGRYRRKVKAGDIISEAFKTWAQVGVPYVLFKDSINMKSNMKNVAPICSSNLCTEILIPSWSNYDVSDFSRFNKSNTHGEFGVCNLAAICLESFVGTAACNAAPVVDYAGIIEASALEVRVLNNVIDLNYYPTEECRRSNRRHRPIGIGIMGLADVYARLKIPYGSADALNVAKSIAACVYYGAMRESARLAAQSGAYESFDGSPASEGKLQPDLWNEDSEVLIEEITGGAITKRDWSELRRNVQAGIRNAYVTAYMPTATTSNIIGQNECFEPFTSNIYTRKTLAGEFLMVNRHLMNELVECRVWDERIRKKILMNGGSVQGIKEIPESIRKVYKTSREIHPGLIIKTAAAMAPYICQSMSMNLFLTEPNLPKIVRFLMDGWHAGLKTGMYYCHTQPAVGSQKTSCTESCESCAI